MTNMIISPRQRQGKCPEDGQTLIRHSKCQTDADCMKGQDVKGGHGKCPDKLWYHIFTSQGIMTLITASINYLSARSGLYIFLLWLTPEDFTRQ